MARKEKTIKIPDDAGRDHGRTFHIKEMGAMKTEKFATRLILILVSSGFEIPGWDENDGVEALINIDKEKLIKSILNGLLSSLSFSKLEPLLDEMLSCVTFKAANPDGKLSGVEQQLTVDNTDDYIEDVKTLLLLRKEIFSLHVGFDLTGALSNFPGSQEKETGKATPTTVTPRTT